MATYRDASMDEAVKMVLTSNRSAVQSAKSYYAARGEQDVVDKIDKARKLARIERLKLKLEETDK